jgi:hypothetical protein
VPCLVSPSSRLSKVLTSPRPYHRTYPYHRRKVVDHHTCPFRTHLLESRSRRLSLAWSLLWRRDLTSRLPFSLVLPWGWVVSSLSSREINSNRSTVHDCSIQALHSPLCIFNTSHSDKPETSRSVTLLNQLESSGPTWLTYLLVVDNDGLFDFSVPPKLVFQISLVCPDAEAKDTEDIVGRYWSVILPGTRRGIVVRPGLQMRLGHWLWH